MKAFLKITFAIFLTTFSFSLYAQQRTASVSGNWNNTATWGGSSVPTSSNAVIINPGITVTVDVATAVCASVSINVNVANGTGTLQFNSGSVLTVTGNVNVGFNAAKIGILTMTNGGTLKVGGSFTIDPSGGTFTPGSGTVEYNGANQTIANVSYNNLSLSGSGLKTFPALANIASPTTTDNPIWTIQELKIFSGVTVSLSYPGTNPTAVANRAYKVAKLYLWESGKLVGQVNGTYKGTGTRTSDPFTSAIEKAALGTSTGVFTSALAALPVTLSNFTAKQTTDNNVSLAWVTSSESVNKGFSIERQEDGSGKFQTLGFIPTKAEGGNSQSTLAYSFKDVTAKKGTNMYRLVQEDLDGKKSYSEVRVVKLTEQSVSNVYPNPSTGAINISRSNDGKKMNIQVLDQAGRVISQVNNIIDSNYRMNLPQPGIYSIKMMYPETGEQSIQRIVVQK